MGLLSKFEGKMEDTVEGAADRMGAAPLSPVQIAKKAEKQMRREKMVGAGKQYAPTLYTVLVNADDDRRLLGYYPTLAGETETYLPPKPPSRASSWTGSPCALHRRRRFAPRQVRRHCRDGGGFPLVEQLRQGRVRPLRHRSRRAIRLKRPLPQAGYGYQQPAPTPALAPRYRRRLRLPAAPVDEYVEDDYYEDDEPRQAYIYDITNDRASRCPARPRPSGESKNDIVIPDINVSRVHAEIRRRVRRLDSHRPRLHQRHLRERAPDQIHRVA